MSSAVRRIPYGDDAAVRKRQDLERAQKEQASARVLDRSTIGTGGTLVVDGTLEVDGNLIVPAGSLSSPAGSMSAGLDVLAGRDVNATRDVVAGRDVTATGNVSGANVTATNVTGANVYAQSLATLITAGRVALWGRTSDGYIATASSSERFKTNMVEIDVEDRAAAILQISVMYFEYIDEVRKRDDPTFDGYVGPGYHVGVNLGGIAERLHELGLWEWVVYERDADDVLILNEAGDPVPTGIHDILMGWAALIVAQALNKRITAIEQHLGL